jgi:hypothetical protein
MQNAGMQNEIKIPRRFRRGKEVSQSFAAAAAKVVWAFFVTTCA